MAVLLFYASPQKDGPEMILRENFAEKIRLAGNFRFPVA
jgi:hypothetical protein